MGYLLPFEFPPALPERPVHQSTYSLDLAKHLALPGEVKKMLEKGAVEIVKVNSPGFYSHIFLVPKATERHGSGWILPEQFSKPSERTTSC